LAIALGQPRPRDAEAVRHLWEQVGVVPDPLSSTVTSLGLRPTGDDALATWLRHCSETSEPTVITLAQLRRSPLPPLDPSEGSYVIENPSLLSHAAADGRTGPPIICSSGRPSIAVVTLIGQLGAEGSICRQHADFDAAGLAITAWLAERAGTIPWLMTADAYRNATAARRQRVRLDSPVPDTVWDPDLATAMSATGVAVYEEELRLTLPRCDGELTAALEPDPVRLVGQGTYLPCPSRSLPNRGSRLRRDPAKRDPCHFLATPCDALSVKRAKALY